MEYTKPEPYPTRWRIRVERLFDLCLICLSEFSMANTCCNMYNHPSMTKATIKQINELLKQKLLITPNSECRRMCTECYNKVNSSNMMFDYLVDALDVYLNHKIEYQYNYFESRRSALAREFNKNRPRYNDNQFMVLGPRKYKKRQSKSTNDVNITPVPVETSLSTNYQSSPIGLDRLNSEGETTETSTVASSSGYSEISKLRKFRKTNKRGTINKRIKKIPTLKLAKVQNNKKKTETCTSLPIAQNHQFTKLDINDENQQENLIDLDSQSPIIHDGEEIINMELDADITDDFWYVLNESDDVWTNISESDHNWGPVKQVEIVTGSVPDHLSDVVDCSDNQDCGPQTDPKEIEAELTTSTNEHLFELNEMVNRAMTVDNLHQLPNFTKNNVSEFEDTVEATMIDTNQSSISVSETIEIEYIEDESILNDMTDYDLLNNNNNDTISGEVTRHDNKDECNSKKEDVNCKVYGLYFSFQDKNDTNNEVEMATGNLKDSSKNSDQENSDQENSVQNSPYRYNEEDSTEHGFNENEAIEIDLTEIFYAENEIRKNASFHVISLPSENELILNQLEESICIHPYQDNYLIIDDNLVENIGDNCDIENNTSSDESNKILEIENHHTTSSTEIKLDKQKMAWFLICNSLLETFFNITRADNNIQEKVELHNIDLDGAKQKVYNFTRELENKETFEENFELTELENANKENSEFANKIQNVENLNNTKLEMGKKYKTWKVQQIKIGSTNFFSIINSAKIINEKNSEAVFENLSKEFAELFKIVNNQITDVIVLGDINNEETIQFIMEYNNNNSNEGNSTYYFVVSTISLLIQLAYCTKYKKHHLFQAMYKDPGINTENFTKFIEAMKEKTHANYEKHSTANNKTKYNNLHKNISRKIHPRIEIEQKNMILHKIKFILQKNQLAENKAKKTRNNNNNLIHNKLDKTNNSIEKRNHEIIKPKEINMQIIEKAGVQQKHPNTDYSINRSTIHQIKIPIKDQAIQTQIEKQNKTNYEIIENIECKKLKLNTQEKQLTDQVNKNLSGIAHTQKNPTIKEAEQNRHTNIKQPARRRKKNLAEIVEGLHKKHMPNIKKTNAIEQEIGSTSKTLNTTAAKQPQVLENLQMQKINENSAAEQAKQRIFAKIDSTSNSLNTTAIKQTRFVENVHKVRMQKTKESDRIVLEKRKNYKKKFSTSNTVGENFNKPTVGEVFDDILDQMTDFNVVEEPNLLKVNDNDIVKDDDDLQIIDSESDNDLILLEDEPFNNEITQKQNEDRLLNEDQDEPNKILSEMKKNTNQMELQLREYITETIDKNAISTNPLEKMFLFQKIKLKLLKHRLYYENINRVFNHLYPIIMAKHAELTQSKENNISEIIDITNDHRDTFLPKYKIIREENYKRYLCSILFSIQKTTLIKINTQTSLGPMVNNIRNLKKPADYFKCPMCNLKYTSAVYLKIHMFSTHKQYHKCCLCLKTLQTKAEYAIHNLELLSCIYCGKLNTLHQYEVHLITHEEPFKCQKCFNQCQNFNDYQEHKLNHKNGVICIICNKVFYSKILLVRHLGLQHQLHELSVLGFQKHPRRLSVIELD